MATSSANIEGRRSPLSTSSILGSPTKMPIAQNESSQDNPDAIIAKLVEELTLDMVHSPQIRATTNVQARSGHPFDQYIPKVNHEGRPSLTRTLENDDTPKAPRHASVRLKHRSQPHGVRFDSPQRPNLKRAMAHAMCVLQEHDAFQEKRAMIMKKREYVIYQETVLTEKQRWLLDAMKTAEATILSGRSGVTLGAELQSGLDATLLEMSKVEFQTKTVWKLKDDLNKREVAVQMYEDRFYEAIEQFVESAGQVETDDARAASSSASTSNGGEYAKEPTPSDVDDYLDKLGDLRILLERKYELEAEHAEEVAQRALLEDQEQPMPSHIARQTDMDYDRERDELIHELDAARAAVQKALVVCTQRGHDPTKWQTTSGTDNDDDDDDDNASAADDVVVKRQTDANLSFIESRTGFKSKSLNILQYVQPSVLTPFTLQSSMAEASSHAQNVQTWLSALPPIQQNDSAQAFVEQTHEEIRGVEHNIT